MGSSDAPAAAPEKEKSFYKKNKQAAKWLLGRVQSSLLVALLLYKLLAALVFLPAIRQVWVLALRFSPTQYITTDNMLSLLRSPLLVAAIWSSALRQPGGRCMSLH